MKDELLNIVKLLGEENEKKLKDGITDLLLKRIEEDLDDIGVYLMDLESMLDDIRREIEKEAKEKIMKKYMDKLEGKLNDLSL